ncbi:hypothetical protein Cgig2_019377 [Carnegiea gigantea]|uniref:Uncharacterized protein n=1 Tax=Carnegiea gigantea TaxID=171969 RepID=A0A9Q1KCL6_9CARY|nr:hypothetical protein Cgig2_019377 [Carnegiea gigantea]
MVVSNMVELGVLSEIVVEALKEALENIQWYLFERWLGIHKDGLLSACLHPTATLVIANPAVPAAVAYEDALEESVRSSETLTASRDVGGWNEKGSVHRLDNATEHFCKRPIAGISSDKPSYTPAIVSQLQSELDLTKAELNSTKNKLQKQRQSVESQQRMMKEQQQRMEEH